MYILGMAKSNLNLKAGQAIRLELDFFKLAFAVAAFRANEQKAQGYFQVLSVKSVKRVNSWCKKYNTDDAIIVLPVPILTPQQWSELEEEKEANAAGIVLSNVLQHNPINPSVADLGEQIGELALTTEIFQRHPNVKKVQIFDKNIFPHGIKWDFYGTA